MDADSLRHIPFEQDQLPCYMFGKVTEINPSLNDGCRMVAKE